MRGEAFGELLLDVRGHPSLEAALQARPAPGRPRHGSGSTAASGPCMHTWAGSRCGYRGPHNTEPEVHSSVAVTSDPRGAHWQATPH